NPAALTTFRAGPPVSGIRATKVRKVKVARPAARSVKTMTTKTTPTEAAIAYSGPTPANRPTKPAAATMAAATNSSTPVSLAATAALPDRGRCGSSGGPWLGSRRFGGRLARRTAAGIGVLGAAGAEVESAIRRPLALVARVVVVLGS